MYDFGSVKPNKNLNQCSRSQASLKQTHESDSATESDSGGDIPIPGAPHFLNRSFLRKRRHSVSILQTVGI